MKYTLILPITIVLMIISGLGNTVQKSTIDGGTIVSSIVFSFGLWFAGYIEGKNN